MSKLLEIENSMSFNTKSTNPNENNFHQTILDICWAECNSNQGYICKVLMIWIQELNSNSRKVKQLRWPFCQMKLHANKCNHQKKRHANKCNQLKMRSLRWNQEKKQYHWTSFTRGFMHVTLQTRVFVHVTLQLHTSLCETPFVV